MINIVYDKTILKFPCFSSTVSWQYQMNYLGNDVNLETNSLEK